MKPGRNDPCPCGSGKKFKKCCADKPQVSPPTPSRASAPPAAICNELIALFSAGRHAELERQARALLFGFPDSGFAWKMLGAALKEQGKDALSAFRKAAELSPERADAHNNLGLVLHERGEYIHAAACYRRALQIDSSLAEIHLNLGHSLQEFGKFDEALTCYRRALELQPGLADAHCGMGATLRKLARLEEASESYRKALELQPGLAEAHFGLGTLQRDLGQADDMSSSFRRALELDSGFIRARLELVKSRKVRSGDEDFISLIAHEQATRTGSGALAAGTNWLLNFALGKGYDDLGECDKAFTHFLEGARIRRAGLSYDPARTSRYFDSIIANFNAATMERLRGGGHPSPFPVFVLGMPRSGTTLAEQIISSHPEVQGAGELPYLREAAGSGFPENLQQLDRMQLSALGGAYVDKLQLHGSDKSRVTDKMPENFMALGLIHLMLPGARIIHLSRNPVDTCLSCFTQPFAWQHEHTYDLAELGQYYVDYHRLMRHWREVLPEGAFLDVQYEDLVNDQKGQSRRIIEYCGLEWSDACLDFHKNERAVQTASVMQVRQPMYKSSMERWRRYEKFLDPLFDALGDLAPQRSFSRSPDCKMEPPSAA